MVSRPACPPVQGVGWTPFQRGRVRPQLKADCSPHPGNSGAGHGLIGIVAVTNSPPRSSGDPHGQTSRGGGEYQQ
jgi:hypothetical protein